MTDEAMREAVAHGVRALVEWACGPARGQVPDAVLRKTALVTADNIAAMIAARDEPEVAKVHDQLLAGGATPVATVFRVAAPRTDTISATLANGIAGSWCELDEGYRLAPCHGGLYTLPALLAEAEARGLTTRETLAAAAVAYEVTARFARCWIFPSMALHPHPQSAAIGGAIATALVRGYDARLTLDAVTAAASLITVGDYRHAVDGALVRNVWAAVGTANGLRAADWARCGIGGLATSPYDIYTGVLGQAPAPAALIDSLGEEWAVTRGYHKIHACCQSTHSAVEAMLMAREALPPGTDSRSIERVVLETHRPGMTNPRPATTLAAKFSFEHVLATAQFHGHARAEAFAASTLDQPEIERLREHTELRRFEPVLPRPHDRPARVRLVLQDGREIVRECLSAEGGPDRPFADAVVLGKIRDITAGPCPRMVAEVERLLALEPAALARPWRNAVDALLAS